MSWFRESNDPAKLDAVLTTPQLAGAYWYYVSSIRQAFGLVGAEGLPTSTLIGKIASACKSTPTTTVYDWLLSSLAAWPAAKGRVPDISPELILQSWYRDKLVQPAPVYNNRPVAQQNAIDPDFLAQMNARVNRGIVL